MFPDSTLNLLFALRLFFFFLTFESLPFGETRDENWFFVVVVFFLNLAKQGQFLFVLHTAWKWNNFYFNSYLFIFMIAARRPWLSLLTFILEISLANPPFTRCSSVFCNDRSFPALHIQGHLSSAPSNVSLTLLKEGLHWCHFSAHWSWQHPTSR